MAKLGGIWQSEVARGVPFDKNNISFTTDNVQEALQQLRTNIVWDPEFTTNSLNGNLTLTSTSTSLQFITGTATGFSVTLPDATTLFNGTQYQIVNTGSQNIDVKDNSGMLLLVVSQTSTSFITLEDNSTAAGVWVFFQHLVNVASGILNYTTTSLTPFATTSTTDVVITGFTLTPVAGTYGVWYSASASNSTSNADVAFTLYKNSVAINDSIRGLRTVGAGAVFPETTQTVVQVDGTETIDGRVRTSGGTLTIGARSLLLIRLGT